MAVEGVIDGRKFLEQVEQVFVPTLGLGEGAPAVPT